MTLPQLHAAILSETTRIIDATSDHKEIYGRDLIDLPEDELILYGVKLPYSDGGSPIKPGMTKEADSTIELTLSTPPARPTFEWLAEITIKTPSELEHYLLRPDATIVETYGKTVLDVDEPRADSLLGRLKLV